MCTEPKVLKAGHSSRKPYIGYFNESALEFLNLQGEQRSVEGEYIPPQRF